MNEFTPMIIRLSSISGPPELPGLIVIGPR